MCLAQGCSADWLSRWQSPASIVLTMLHMWQAQCLHGAHWHAAYLLTFAWPLPNPVPEGLMSLYLSFVLSVAPFSLSVQPGLSAVESPVSPSGSSRPTKYTPLFFSVQTLDSILSSLCLEAPFHKSSHVVVSTLQRTFSDGKPIASRGSLLLL